MNKNETLHTNTENIRKNGKELENKLVNIKGWVWNKRSSGKIRFLILRDGKGFIQCVIDNPELFSIFDECTQESTCEIEGILKEDKRSPLGFEILTKTIKLIHKTIDYPITPKEHGTDFLLDHRHLWIRSRKQFAILRIRHSVKHYIREYLNQEGFIEFDSPIFTPSACEGTTTLFEVDYFGEKMYLSQSGQLYQEAGALSFKKVYCFGPTFRAEKSKTRRHLIEFWMVEPEVAFATLEDIIDISQKMISYVIQKVLENNTYELILLERNVEDLRKIVPPFYRITYSEAVDIIKQKGISFNFGDDFGAPEETAISENFDKPVIITHYPKNIKPFYMKIDPQNPEFVLNMDIIAPEGYGEIVGGSQREDDYQTLLNRMKEENIPIEDYQWYLDLRKYGSVPHSGFGLGIERFVAWICKLEHVRETIPFPRMLYRYKP
ncbi:MAG: asparagine--tRNA ligase [Candidatus Calescibacterium sp.]|nr:asparagine--tRNA ligase [Candidatus Calescibacterium sp.]MDW8132824.1 asparagine--tRNA ligase [Candidatus Calescibacterium sp.]